MVLSVFDWLYFSIFLKHFNNLVARVCCFKRHRYDRYSVQFKVIIDHFVLRLRVVGFRQPESCSDLKCTSNEQIHILCNKHMYVLIERL